jgi:Glycosyl hydrolase family 57
MSRSTGEIRRKAILNIKNIPGRRVARKLVVLECDDYGGIRTPSREVYEMFVDRGLADPASRYRFDTLAGAEDMELLFSTLESVKDGKANPAVMTPFCNVANPDFERIRQSGFNQYHFESFTDTLLNYGRGPEVFELWKQGMDRGVFVPEFHGREHISVQLWMQKLREGNRDLLLAFEHAYVALRLKDIPSAASRFRPEFFFTSMEELPSLKESIEKGAQLFQDIFSYKPRVLAPSNAIFHPDLEYSVAKAGIKFLNVWHMNPIPALDGKVRKKYYRNGSRAASGLAYYVRNCAFEPTDREYAGIDNTLEQIHAAFRWRKPAIISTHRANFVGGIEPSNRETGLRELKKLLQAIIKRWPDAEFVSSSDMLNQAFQEK